MSNLPKFYPRSQTTGSKRWSCVFCAHINVDQIRPGSFALKCGRCDRRIFYGDAFHIPKNSATQTVRDVIIPQWADDEYPFDTIPQKLFDPMPPAWFDPERKVSQRGRVHVVVLHDNIYSITDGTLALSNPLALPSQDSDR